LNRTLIFFAVTILGCQRAPGTSASRADMPAIEQLHRQDVAATLSRNPRALAELWTDDAVRMQPGGPAEVGRQTIYTSDSTKHERSPRTQVVRYVPTIRDVQVVQDWAIEWGNFDGAYKRWPGDSLHILRGNLLRVLHRQPDGSWRFARVMWSPAE
jgi:ketosteroid isomerase-like protein